ncbi:hypothetical protein RZ532_01100 [Nitratireductor aquimarinus]|uniref:hypothetical protein n=1 Tax=Nitratireductor aquimarinus TaxID=889300 RepID=UPI002935915C|nr:hypothetical protein [Nitratireductor aquimarinus]MDV2964558.1 hypothetical protein [Nitratireductor aquimarinus]
MPRAVNGIKQCSKCREFKPVEEFSKAVGNSDGCFSYCKCCTRERCRRYREKNPEKIREKDRRYREKNPEKIREKDRRYYEENREKIRRYYEENREKIRRYREENREAIREQSRRYKAKQAAALKLCKDLNLID